MVQRQQLVLRVRRDGPMDGSESQELEEQNLQRVAETTLERCGQNDKGLKALDISNAVFANRFYSLLGDAIQHNTVLQELYLDNCNIDDEALRKISSGIERNGGSAVRALSLEDNQLRCRGAGHLARLLRGRSRWARTFGGYKTHASGPGRGLQYLSLKGNAISSIGSKAIAEALMSSDDSLERLSLEANRIDDWGAGWFAMALRNHNVLQCLDLHRNPIGTDGIEELKSACECAKASLVLLKPKAHVHLYEEELDTEGKLQQEDEEQLTTMVEGQRLTTVYVSEAPRTRPSSASTACSSSRAYSRPGSASRREGQAQRRNGHLDIEEPAGGVMVDSAPAVTGRHWTEGLRPSSQRVLLGAAEAGCPSAPSRSTKVSAPGLSCSVAGGDGSGTLRRSQQCAATPGASTYSRTTGGDAEADVTHERCHPGERSAFAEEMETATGLAPPSRFRRKLRVKTEEKNLKDRSNLGGCGASAARGLRRCQSAPSKRTGMLMGPHAASGVYGTSRCY